MAREYLQALGIVGAVATAIGGAVATVAYVLAYMAVQVTITADGVWLVID